MTLITLLVVAALCSAFDSVRWSVALVAALVFAFKPLWLIDLLTLLLFGTLFPFRR